MNSRLGRGYFVINSNVIDIFEFGFSRSERHFIVIGFSFPEMNKIAEGECLKLPWQGFLCHIFI